MSEEIKMKVGDQWFYRGNRSLLWLAMADRLDGSMSGIAERVPSEVWPILEALSEYRQEVARLQYVLGNAAGKLDIGVDRYEVIDDIEKALHPTQPAEGSEKK